VPDFIAASDVYPFSGPTCGAGIAKVYSGSNGAPLFTFAGTFQQEHVGRSVAGAGDLDGDGHGDLLVGAPTVYYPPPNRRPRGCIRARTVP
jgi:hypothetical protein